MNGLNSKTSSKRIQWKRTIIIVGVAYAAVVLLLGIFIFNIPTFYYQLTKTNIENTVASVNQALADNDAEALEAIVNDTAMELVVVTETNVVFNTMPTTDFSVLKETIDTRALSYSAAYETKVDNQVYQVWMAIYKTDFQQFFIVAMLITFGGAVLLCAIMTGLLFYMFRKLVSPLKRLRDNIFKLKSYRLNEVASSQEISDYDLLSEELTEFTEDLQGKLQSFTVSYTGLEQELQARQERSNYKEQLVTALVHDLKTPLNISSIQAEKMAQSAPASDADAFDVLLRNNNRVLNDVNEVLTVLRMDEVSKLQESREIDVVEISRATLRLFQPMFQKRDIASFIDAPKSLLMQFNEIEFKQIMHNVISNASQYADIGGSFELEIDQLDGMVWIRAYNDKADVSQIQFDQVFDLFYRAGNNEHAFGSGVGMYTIKSMVEQHRGSCRFEAFDEGVQLIIELPLNGGEQHA
ncbi:sensor histidine kinase [Culicoidibacter larvae]|uniref:histidine kinase n=1 Tax=Culicoidibacter larvae TaxID=2579976 RepID=A0A5R8QBI1_9FIRM|nr:HAMP domain-containing sensor histidine kinase [Culicoidibacter larvae]TLG72688.1 HAMP domain-containing histidine kinase [Culicoidibacter larvae]